MSRIHEVLQVPGSWARGFLGFHMFSVLTVPGSWVRGSHTFAVPTVPSSQSWSGRSESRFSVPGCQGPGTSHRSLRSRQAMARERVVIDTNVFRERSAFNRMHSGPVCRLFVTLLSPRFDRYVLMPNVLRGWACRRSTWSRWCQPATLPRSRTSIRSGLNSRASRLLSTRPARWVQTWPLKACFC